MDHFPFLAKTIKPKTYNYEFVDFLIPKVRKKSILIIKFDKGSLSTIQFLLIED